MVYIKLKAQSLKLTTIAPTIGGRSKTSIFRYKIAQFSLLKFIG